MKRFVDMSDGELLTLDTLVSIAADKLLEVADELAITAINKTQRLTADDVVDFEKIAEKIRYYAEGLK